MAHRLPTNVRTYPIWTKWHTASKQALFLLDCLRFNLLHVDVFKCYLWVAVIQSQQQQQSASSSSSQPAANQQQPTASSSSSQPAAARQQQQQKTSSRPAAPAKVAQSSFPQGHTSSGTSSCLCPLHSGSQVSTRTLLPRAGPISPWRVGHMRPTIPR